MPLQSEFDYSDHNEKLAHHISSLGTHSDWVVTVSFYSALHCVRGRLFPLNMSNGEGSEEIKNFDEYYSKIGTDKISKHKMLIALVVEHLPNIKSKYKFLHDCCHTARYVNYHISTEYATQALRYLAEIKKECVAP